ncbi:50S ribosomal protein L25/general stress protein Ctc [Aidingimonas lacisalsi]|uniref:50S ribosomal protein L25/general stress protein Ctc n=1 Tax=Aidingimonas lacisalsi TaxID=2604086 RepID=UPI0011D24742|nr:50S ribosomal protein L25/general stress protein Ctc [Aidingimonas lacisalsi]
MSDYTLTGNVRHDLGKGASRRLRRANLQVPAIVYGGEKAPHAIAIDKTVFYKAIEEEAFFSSLITLDIEGKKEQVVVRDLQRHPYKQLVTHADFLRIDASQELTMHVPLHVVGEENCQGIKEQDGLLHILATDVEVSCLPKDLPEYLEVDISELGLGDTLHISDLKLPAGVSSVALSHGEDHDAGVVSITHPTRGTTEAAGEEDEPSQDASDNGSDGGEEDKSE